jgi:hypothetical protein
MNMTSLLKSSMNGLSEAARPDPEVVAIAGCLSFAGTAANAAEIALVVSAGPLPDVMGTLLPMFESATGNKVEVSFKAGLRSLPMSNRGPWIWSSPTASLSTSLPLAAMWSATARRC